MRDNMGCSSLILASGTGNVMLNQVPILKQELIMASPL